MAKTGIVLCTNFDVLEMVLYQRRQYRAIVAVSLQIFGISYDSQLRSDAAAEQQSCS